MSGILKRYIEIPYTKESKTTFVIKKASHKIEFLRRRFGKMPVHMNISSSGGEIDLMPQHRYRVIFHSKDPDEEWYYNFLISNPEKSVSTFEESGTGYTLLRFEISFKKIKV